MAEVTRTMSEWIEIDQRERRQRRELLKELAEYQKTHPPLIMAAFRPKAVTAPPMPPKPVQPGKVELSDNPSHEELADFLGISPEKLTDELGGMTFEQLCQRLNMPPKDVAETLQLMSWAGSTPVALQVAVAKLTRYGVRACHAQASRKAGRKEQLIQAAAKLKAMSRKLRG